MSGKKKSPVALPSIIYTQIRYLIIFDPAQHSLTHFIQERYGQMFTYQDYQKSAEALSERLKGFAPEWLLVLGSGLGSLADAIENPIKVDYGELPSFPVSTAPGHRGRFVAGMLAGKPVLAMQGRFHIYEGYSAEQAAFPVRVAKLLGVRSMIVTNASGGINLGYNVGDLMLISDFIRLAFHNPLTGPNIPEFGERFCDMSKVFDREYNDLAKQLAAGRGISLREGVYMYATGPNYETPAEIRAFRTLGADAVGMSTMPECIIANHCGMRIFGVSLITNMAAGILDQPLSEKEVLDTAAASKERFADLLLDFLSAAKL